MNGKRALGWVAGLLVGAMLLACGGGTEPSKGTAPGSAAAEAPDKGAESDGPVVAQLGSKGLIFKDEKIDVAISKPSAYKPSRYAERVPKGSKAFVVTVEVTNNRKQAIRVDAITITASVGEVAAEATPIFDSEAGLKGAPSTALLPGKTARFKYGFVAPTTEAHPVVNINVSPWELGMTTGLFQGRL